MSTPKSSMQDSPPPSLRSRLIPFGLWLLVLAPIVGCALMVRHYAMNIRFLDDWVWADDLVQWNKGDYWRLYYNLISVHLEHRPIVARTLAFLVTLWGHGDVRAQNILSFLWLVLAFGCLCWLWLRVGKLTIRQAGVALFLASAVFFTPAQWQNLLWPICHETPMPIFFLLLSLCVAFTSWSWWVRSLLGALLAVLGMLSFASGLLLWGLPLPVLLTNGKFSGMADRMKFLLIWGAVFFVTMILYLQVRIGPESSLPTDVIRSKQVKVIAHLPADFVLTYDLHNEVPPSYAYHHGNENTMNNEFDTFLKSPVMDAEFVAVFSGTILVRGWSADIMRVAERVGFVLIIGWLAAGIYLVWYIKDEVLRTRLLPALCFGAYTPLTALMVAVGRIYAGKLGSALNARYAVHQTVLVVALIWAWVVIMKHRAERAEIENGNEGGVKKLPGFQPSWSVAMLGLLGGVVAVGWLHGDAMMFEWQAARYRAAAAQYVSQVFSGHNHFVASVAGNHLIARDYSAELAKYGLLRDGLAPSNDLFESFKVSETTPILPRVKGQLNHGEISRLFKTQKLADKPASPDNWQIEGFACLPGTQRPADAIILAYQVPGGKWTMFGLTQAYGAPRYLSRSLGKDLFSMIPSRDTFPVRMCCTFDPDVHFQTEPPPNALISAWAVDMDRHRIFRVLRPVKAASDPAEGVTLETLAQDIERDDD